MINYDRLYNKDYYKDSTSKSHYVNKELSFEEFPNAYALPLKMVEVGASIKNGIGCATASKEYIKKTAINPPRYVGYDFDETQTEYIDEKVVFLGVFHSCWGTFITDAISRIWFLKSPEYRHSFSKYKLVYIPLGNFKFWDNHIQLLDTLGINSAQLVPITKITQFKSIIIPDACFFSSDDGTRYYTKEYVSLVKEIKSHANKSISSKYNSKLYFTYARFGIGKQIGEHKLEKFFKSQGYQIIAPEKYSFQEQLNMLSNCTHFASTIGSSSHNCIFLPDHAQVILIPRAYYLTAYQVALNETTDLDIHFIDSSLSILTNRKAPWQGPFYYYVSEELMDFFGCNIPSKNKFWRKNLYDFKKYIRLGFNQPNPAERNAPDFYSAKALYCLSGYYHSSKVLTFLRKSITFTSNTIRSLFSQPSYVFKEKLKHLFQFTK